MTSPAEVLRIAACVALLGAANPARAQDEDARMPSAPVNEQVLHLPGDPARPVLLEATLFEPAGDGPFPLAVMNHGAEGRPSTVPRYRASFAIDYLLSRGYAVLAPMMRGFAGSGGHAVIEGCDDGAIGRANARDILAAIDAVSKRPEIDGAKVLVMGQSFGGWNSLAVGAAGDARVKGVVNFVGGLRASNCDAQDEAMWRGIAEFGAASHVPSIWFYGEIDKLFPQSVWRRDYERFTAAGGHATLVDFGAVDDAHNLLGHVERIGLWAPKLDAYLAERGLPHRLVHPEYMPPPPPPRTNYAALDDVAAVPFVGRADPGFYATFLADKQRPRALAVGPKSVAGEFGGFDPAARALAKCAKQSQECILYAYDDSVVWTGPPAGKAARIGGVAIFGKTAEGGAATILQRFVGVAKDCSATPLPEVKIAAPPAHGAARIEHGEDAPEFAPTSPLAACSGVKTPALRLSYTPRSGFHGVDFVALAVEEAGKPAQTVKYAVHVE